MTGILKTVVIIAKSLVLIWLATTTIGAGLCGITLAGNLITAPRGAAAAEILPFILIALLFTAGCGAATHAVWRSLRPKDFKKDGASTKDRDRGGSVEK